MRAGSLERLSATIAEKNAFTKGEASGKNELLNEIDLPKGYKWELCGDKWSIVPIEKNAGC